MAGVAPIQPLPSWMSRTYLPIGNAGSSTLVTIQFPQTYSGPNTEGLGWPWTVPGDPAQGTLVSVIDGMGDSLIRIGASTSSTSERSTFTPSTEPTSAAISQTQPSSSQASFATTSSALSIPSTASTTSAASSSSSLLSSPASTSAPTSLPPSSTSTPSSTTSQHLPPPPTPIPFKSGIDAGVIVAIVIAAIALLSGVLFLLAACLIHRRRRRKQHISDDWSVISPPPPEMGERNEPNNSVWSRGIPFSAVPFNSRDRTMSGASQRDTVPADEQEHLIGYRDEGERDSLAELGGVPSSTIERRPRHASNSTDATQPSSTQSSSTGTRSSLIAQFPTFRKPSDGSGSPGGNAGQSQGGAGGAGGPSGYEDEGPSPGTLNSIDLFYSPPARPASGRRTVPASNPLIGLGRPTDALNSAIPPIVGMQKSSATTAGSSGVSSRLFEQNRRDSASTRTDTTSEPPSLTGKPARPLQTMSNTIPEGDLEEGPSPIQERVDEQGRIRSSNHTQEASLAGWLKGFSFLRPYLGSPSGPRTMALPSQPEEDALLSSTSKDAEAPAAEAGTLLASSAPVARDSPAYRRVTTTAAAYDTQDLVDLAARSSTARQAANAQAAGNESSSEDEDEDQAVNSGRSFLGRSQSGSSHLQTSPTSPAGMALLKPGARRWSGATLGQPIRRVSNMSSLSLTDLPESIASSIASARQRNKSRARSGSQHSSNPLSREHSGSAASLLSMKSSTSRKSGSRRGENSSGGSGSGSGSGSGHGSANGSHGRGSRRSNRSDASHLQRVNEVFREDRDAPEVPQLPPISGLP